MILSGHQLMEAAGFLVIILIVVFLVVWGRCFYIICNGDPDVRFWGGRDE